MLYTNEVNCYMESEILANSIKKLGDKIFEIAPKVRDLSMNEDNLKDFLKVLSK